MIDIAGGWVRDLERGPDWLFVKLNSAPQGPGAAPPLADSVWALLQQHFVYRVVLECEQIECLSSEVAAQLTALRDRLEARGGVMRLCGLSPANQQAIERGGLECHFPHYADREEAVMANRPTQPR